MTFSRQLLINKKDTSIRGAAVDLWRGLLMVRSWITFGAEDVQQRYRRSKLGLAWLLISFAIFVAGVSLFFANFSSLDPYAFVLYVALGYAIYTLITSSIIDGCSVFVESESWIKSVNLPFSFHVYRYCTRSIFVFVIQTSICILLICFFGKFSNILPLYCLFSILLILLNIIFIQYFLGFLCARFRDITHLVSSITRLLLFVTPILWVREEQSGIRAVAADLNPLTHYIEILRNPMLGDPPRDLSLILVLTCTLITGSAALTLASRARNRLAYWL